MGLAEWLTCDKAGDRGWCVMNVGTAARGCTNTPTAGVVIISHPKGEVETAMELNVWDTNIDTISDSVYQMLLRGHACIVIHHPPINDTVFKQSSTRLSCKNTQLAIYISTSLAT